MKKYISEEEREALGALTSKGKHRSQKILNALILLGCDAGEFQTERSTNEEIARVLKISMRKITGKGTGSEGGPVLLEVVRDILDDETANHVRRSTTAVSSLIWRGCWTSGSSDRSIPCVPWSAWTNLPSN